MINKQINRQDVETTLLFLAYHYARFYVEQGAQTTSQGSSSSGIVIQCG